MLINSKLRRIIPICSLLIALGTVAFQTIENSSKKEKLKQLKLLELNQSSLEIDSDINLKED